MLKAVL